MRAWIDKVKQIHVPLSISSSTDNHPQKEDLSDAQALTDPFYPGNEITGQLASVASTLSAPSSATQQTSALAAAATPVRLLGTLMRANEAYAVLVVGGSTLSLKVGEILPDQTGKLLKIDASGAQIQTPGGIQRLAFADYDAASSPAAADSPPHATPPARLRHRFTGTAS